MDYVKNDLIKIDVIKIDETAVRVIENADDRNRRKDLVEAAKRFQDV